MAEKKLNHPTSGAVGAVPLNPYTFPVQLIPTICDERGDFVQIDETENNNFLSFLQFKWPEIQNLLHQALTVSCISVSSDSVICSATSLQQLEATIHIHKNKYNDIRLLLTEFLRNEACPGYLDVKPTLLCLDLYIDPNIMAVGEFHFKAQTQNLNPTPKAPPGYPTRAADVTVVVEDGNTRDRTQSVGKDSSSNPDGRSPDTNRDEKGEVEDSGKSKRNGSKKQGTGSPNQDTDDVTSEKHAKEAPYQEKKSSAQLDTVFMLYIPVSFGDAKAVNIVSKCPVLSNIDLKFNSQLARWESERILVPVESQEEIFYHYSVKVSANILKKLLSFGKFKTDRVEEMSSRVWNISEVSRDIFTYTGNKSNIEQCADDLEAFVHYTDEILQEVNMQSVKSITLEWLSMTFIRKLYKAAYKLQLNFVSWFCENVMKKIDSSQILFLTALLGKGLYHSNFHLDWNKDFTTDVAKRCLDSLKDCQRCWLVEETKGFLGHHRFVKELVKKAYGIDMCRFTLIFHFFPLLEYSQINRLMVHCSDYTINDEFVRPCALKLLDTIASDDKAHLLLLDVLKRIKDIPFLLELGKTIERIECLENDVKQLVCKKIQSVTKRKIDSQCNEFKHISDLSKIKSLLIQLYGNYIFDNVKEIIERQIIRIIDSKDSDWNDEWVNVLVEIIKTPKLYEEQLLIRLVLYAIARKRNCHIKNALVQLFNENKVVSLMALHKEQKKAICSTALDEIVQDKWTISWSNDKSVERLERGYSLLNGLSTSQFVGSDEDIQNALNKRMQQWLNLFDLTVILDCSSHLSDDMDRAVFNEHVQEMISHKLGSKNDMNKHLNTLLGTNRQLNLSFKTYPLVKSMLDHHIARKFTNPIIILESAELLCEVLSNCEFWYKISQVKGYNFTDILEHPTYRNVFTLLKTLGPMIESGKVTYGLYLLVNNSIKDQNKDEYDELFATANNWESGKFLGLMKSLNKTCMEIKTATEGIEAVFSFLQHLQTRNTALGVSIHDLDDHRYYITNLHVQTEENKLTMQSLLEENEHFGKWKDLYKKTDTLQTLLKMSTFQEYVKKEIQEKKKDLVENYQADDLLEEESSFCLDLLFGDRTENAVSSEIILNFICDCCVSTFRDAIQYLFYEGDGVTVYEVLAFFKKIKCSENEINEIEKWYSKNIPSETRKALLYVFNMNEIIGNVEALNRLCGVMSIQIEADKSELAQAIKDIIQTEMKSSSITLQNVLDKTSKIDPILEMIGTCEWQIIHELGKAGSLIHFLRDIIDDDLRNIIDAVEEHSEQYVKESTVSDLIQVKRFLSPVLKIPVKTLNELIDQLKNCTSKEIKTIPAQINMCMSNINGLKGLYRSVADRQEVAKEVASNILHKGSVVFLLTQERSKITIDCPKETGKPKFYTMSDVMDLRSKCHLISNSVNVGVEDNALIKDVGSFIGMTDYMLDIWDQAKRLHRIGHFQYQKFNWSTSKNAFKLKLKELADLQSKLKEDITEWEDMLEVARQQQYYINFIQSEQIWLLNDFFTKGVYNERVVSIMKFLTPGLEMPSDAQEFYTNEFSRSKNPLQKKLENLGAAIENIMTKQVSPYMHFPTDEQFRKLTTKAGAEVKNGELFLAHIDAKNTQFLPVLLTLYANTTGKFPKPHEILICNESTSWDEVYLLINRCILFPGDKNDMYNIHAIVGVELLEYETQIRLVAKLKEIEHLKEKRYLLAVLCKSNYLHPILLEFPSRVHRIPGLSLESMVSCLKYACPEVYMITSDVPGLGKSEHIMDRAFKVGKACHSIQISGPISKDFLAELFASSNLSQKKYLHIDIGIVDNSTLLDTFLFELIVLKCAVSGTKIVHLPLKDVAIEVANTLRHQLRDELFVMSCFERIHLHWQNFDDFVVSSNINSQTQIVCQHLHALKEGTLGSRNIECSGKKRVSPLPGNKCRQLLRSYLSSTTDISFTIVNIFISVLSEQLVKFSYSPYFKVENLIQMLQNKDDVILVRCTMVKELIDISREFACRSIHTCKSSQNSAVESKISGINRETNAMLRRVEGMIRWADSNHLLVVFHSQNIETVTPLYMNLRDVPNHVKELFQTQIGRLLDDYNLKPQKELQGILQNIVVKSRVAPSKRFAELLHTYALTPDNLLKMVLIIMRIRTGVPVVLMGETGCGKTTLIRYLAETCDIHLDVFPLHAGISRDEIIKRVSQINEKAMKNKGKEMWLFLDEINTCSHLGLLNNVLCHRKLHNMVLSPNLKCLSACNPYRLREKAHIFTSGLDGKTATDQFSQLVYRVHPLPESLIDYVWDYGTLSKEDENKYIAHMIYGIFTDTVLSNLDKKLVELLSASQAFLRDIEKNEWCVSLRDVHRCCFLVSWFFKMLHEKVKFPKKSYIKPTDENDYAERAVILSLAHCYEVRMHDTHSRQMYWQKVSKILYGDENKTKHIVQNIIRNEQLDILDRMTIEEGIAKNTALKENVFVIFVCMLNRIPIFLVGKPGCSKSLSMQLLRSNLRGLDSEDDYFKTLPQIYVVSYQGSESSTSEGIIKIFEKAEKYKKQEKDNENILPVVLLDEIGLAEISKYNPLKVLHSLLEPNTGIFPEVAVVGISNWALDAAKMNRAIHLSRPDLSKEELFDTGYSISTTYYTDHTVFREEQPPSSVIDEGMLVTLSEAYFSYQKAQKFANFHGLRDFYSLVKYICRKLLEKDLTDSSVIEVIHEGLLRNFGGLPSEINIIVETFFQNLEHPRKIATPTERLIYENINDINARHLMLITSGDSIIGAIGSILKNLQREYRIFYGSRFEEDQKEEYSYRMLSNIIHCMENGIVLILKDLDEIYGSLYDMLNQNYTIVGKKKNCRIALGAHSNPMCNVHELFRCIVLVEENKLDYSDPPFLNRFEKQLLRFEDLLDESEKKLSNDLNDWVKNFVEVNGATLSGLKEAHAFLGYHEGTIPSLIKTLKSASKDTADEDILTRSKHCMLLTCTPDAILRLSCSNLSSKMNEEVDELQQYYLSRQLNDGIKVAVENILHLSHDSESSMKFICFTRSSIHTDIRKLFQNENHIQIESLGTFKSERQMTTKLSTFFESGTATLLIVQCNLSTDADHLLLAKLQIENQGNQYVVNGCLELKKHICFLIHIDRYNIGTHWQFDYCDDWKLYTVDVLDYNDLVPKGTQIGCEGILLGLLNKTPHQLLQTQFQPIEICLKQNMLWAFNCLQYTSHCRTPSSTKELVHNVQTDGSLIKHISDTILNSMIPEETSQSITERTNWQVQIACNEQLLSESGTLINAWKKYLETQVKSALAKVVWFLETAATWDCIVDSKSLSWKSAVLFTQISKVPKQKEIENIEPRGILSMVVTNPTLHLNFPFSRIFLQKLKEVQTVMIKENKGKWLQLDSAHDIDKEQFLELMLKYKFMIEHRFHEIYENSEFDNESVKLLLRDFCNEFSWYKDIEIPHKIRINICRTFLEARISRLELENFTAKVTGYLIVYTLENTRLWNILKMLSLCGKDIISDIQLAIQPYERDISFQAGMLSEPMLKGNQRTEETLGKSESLYDTNCNKEGNEKYDDIMEEERKAGNKNLEEELFSGTYSEDENRLSDKSEDEIDLSDPIEMDRITIVEGESEEIPDLDLPSIHVERDKKHQDALKEKYETVENTILSDKYTEGSSEDSKEDDGIYLEQSDSEESYMYQKIDKFDDTTEDIDTHLEEDTNDLQENCEDYMEDKIVEAATQAIIPFACKIQMYNNIGDWYDKTCAILAYCSKIGTQCSNIHFLRFCLDIVNHAQSQGGEVSDILQSFMNSASSNNYEVNLDSSDALDFLLSYTCIKSDAEVKMEQNQKLVCLYFARCLEYNPYSPLIPTMLTIICDSKLPSKNLDFIGPFIKCVLIEVQEKLEHGVLNLIQGRFQEPGILHEIHKILKDVTGYNDLYVIFYDNIVELVSKSVHMSHAEEDEYTQIFVEAMNLLRKENTVGLQQITCLAFVKIYIGNIGLYFRDKKFSNLLQKVDSYLTSSEEESTPEMTTPLYRYMLYTISKGCIKDLENRCKDFQVALPSSRTIAWPDDNVVSGIGLNLLCLESSFNEVLQALQTLDKNSIHKVLQAKNPMASHIRGIIAAVAGKYYWPKYIQGHLKDTEKDFGKWLANNSQFSDDVTNVLLSLSGIQDFKLSMMNISSQHSHVDVLQATFILHLLSIAVSSVKYDSHHNVCSENHFTLSIFKPVTTSLYPLPGFDKTRKSGVQKSFTCICKVISIAQGTIDSCPTCGSDNIKEIKCYESEESHDNIGIAAEDLLQIESTKICSVVENIILLLVDGCLLAGTALGNKSEWSEEEKMLLEKNFKKRWDEIQSQLCETPKRMSLILHKILYVNTELLFSEGVNFLDTDSVQSYFKNIHSSIRKILLSPEMTLVSFTKEIMNKSGDKGTLVKSLHGLEPSLQLRIIRPASVPHMKTAIDLVTQEYSAQFQFLALLLQWESKLVLIQHLLPILKWQLAFHAAINQTTTRQQASRLDLHQFIHDESRENYSDLQQYYKEFATALEAVNDSHILQNKEVVNKQINYETIISELVVEDSQHFMVKLIKELIFLQNSFLNEVAKLSLQGNEALRFMHQKLVVPISCQYVHHIKAKDLVTFEWSPKLLRFAQNELHLECGHGICYDFNQIEKDLANKLVLGKPMLKFPDDIFRTIYKNEMFHWCSHIFIDIKKEVWQESITNHMQNLIIQAKNENQESIRSALDFLEIVIAMLHTTGGNPEDTILSYATNWNISYSAIKSKTLIDQLDMFLQLCHIVSLYEYIEASLFYLTAEVVTKDFRKPMSSVAESDLKAFTEKGYVSISSFQTALTRLMSRYLRSSNLSHSAVSPDASLKTIICQPSLWIQGVNEDGLLTTDDGQKRKLTDVFPKAILVENTHPVYQYLDNFINEKKKETATVASQMSQLRLFPARKSPRKRTSFFDN